MWIGRSRSFLCYPALSGRLMNIAGFVPTDLDSKRNHGRPRVT